MSLPLLPSAFMSLPGWPSAFMSLPLLPSPFMSLPALAPSFSELLDFWPCTLSLSSARWLLAAPGDLSSDCVAFMPDEGPFFSSDCVAFMSDEGFDWAAEFPRSEDGALCWALEPADGCSRLVPVPCALAKPAPAISATAATDIIKRLIIECLLRCFHCPRRQRSGRAHVPRYCRFHRLCFVKRG